MVFIMGVESGIEEGATEMGNVRMFMFMSR